MTGNPRDTAPGTENSFEKGERDGLNNCTCAAMGRVACQTDARACWEQPGPLLSTNVR